MNKSAKATKNSPVFKVVDKGIYSAQVFGYEVLLERQLHNLWECRVADGIDTGKLLAAAETRTKALVEAYHNILRREQDRLEWVLADEPLRTYGKRGQYNTDIDLGEHRKDSNNNDLFNEPRLKLVKSSELPEEKEVEESERMSGKLSDFLTVEQKLRIKQFYKVRRDHVNNKGFFLLKFDAKGIYEKAYGPFPTAGEAYEEALKIEGVEFPEQETE